MIIYIILAILVVSLICFYISAIIYSTISVIKHCLIIIKTLRKFDKINADYAPLIHMTLSGLAVAIKYIVRYPLRYGFYVSELTEIVKDIKSGEFIRKDHAVEDLCRYVAQESQKYNIVL